MSKELECLERIESKNYLTDREHKEFYSVVEQALQRLEVIDNAIEICKKAMQKFLKDKKWR